MRTESDLQGHHRPDAPGCHRCGLPLLETSTFCPYCERSIHEGRVARIVHWRPAHSGEVRRAGELSATVPSCLIRGWASLAADDPSKLRWGLQEHTVVKFTVLLVPR